ncbi:hypothetical protein BH11CYA1_BH11CYA1_47830 [soil metagenome]
MALELLHNHFVTDEFIVDRFKREAEASQLVQHLNVVDVESWAVTASGTHHLVTYSVTKREERLQYLLAEESAGFIGIAR